MRSARCFCWRKHCALVTLYLSADAEETLVWLVRSWSNVVTRGLDDFVFADLNLRHTKLDHGSWDNCGSAPRVRHRFELPKQIEGGTICTPDDPAA
ncbi:hypothetical protein TRAPUB_11307 [Trametes pubescens]|uniref:Endonuclease/exonuclease/phosphatase domain-containing protein n=1 Tax=Trametes pubescens TaxID=154538 RepID=A0A1M2VX75_TRAPU|nr:hypothetical protein TRAPUB_11307 [Trametes pubescens]